MNRYDLEELTREDFEERFEDYISVVDRSRKQVEVCLDCAEPVSFDDVMPTYRARCEEHGQLTDEQTELSDDYIELHKYWEDTLAEIAYSCTPVYYSDATSIWLDLGCPDPEKIMVTDETRIVDLIQLAVREFSYNYAWQLANEYGFDQ